MPVENEVFNVLTQHYNHAEMTFSGSTRVVKLKTPTKLPLPVIPAHRQRTQTNGAIEELQTVACAVFFRNCRGDFTGPHAVEQIPADKYEQQ